MFSLSLSLPKSIRASQITFITVRLFQQNIDQAMICDGMSYVPAEFMFQHYVDQDANHPLDILPSSRPPQDFQGVSRAQMMMRRLVSFSGVGGQLEEMQVDQDDMSDDGSPLGEKKKRLNMEQVRALEKSFELGNKLEPERKLQLARALGLQPRQVAIWFQNRRARWKTKQLERDYEILKRKFEALKADNDALQAHNKKLHAELLGLKGRESNGSVVERISVNKETDRQGTNNNKHLAPPTIDQATCFTHLLQSSTRSDIQCRKIDQTVPSEQGFCNMFTGSTEDLPGFLLWPEQHNFH